LRNVADGTFWRASSSPDCETSVPYGVICANSSTEVGEERTLSAADIEDVLEAERADSHS
jgi:hypothetical protein